MDHPIGQKREGTRWGGMDYTSFIIVSAMFLNSYNYSSHNQGGPSRTGLFFVMDRA